MFGNKDYFLNINKLLNITHLFKYYNILHYLEGAWFLYFLGLKFQQLNLINANFSIKFEFLIIQFPIEFFNIT
jgi:hypothetical protein